jgi:hypothetical protein
LEEKNKVIRLGFLVLVLFIACRTRG